MMNESNTATTTNTVAPNCRSAFRTHTCGELRLSHTDQHVTIVGWVQKSRDLVHFCFVDVRDRYGITQCICQNPIAGDDGGEESLTEQQRVEVQNYRTAQKLGREFVVQVVGTVIERSNKNPNRATGDIEIQVTSLKVLNEASVPPFLTPEGARDFVVPSRTDPASFFALPQSPQTFKQLLMIGGLDRYFQIVKCFRDEGMRADRQPEFTQIDCEMAFVEREDILRLFEEMIRCIFAETVQCELASQFPRMTWAQAMEQYGSDKPDIRFGMKLVDVTSAMQSKGSFGAVKDAELAVAIVCPGIAETWSNKQIKALDRLARSELVKAKGLVWIKCNCIMGDRLDIASSVSKFYTPEELQSIAMSTSAKDGDLVCILLGSALATRESMGAFRHEMGTKLGLRSSGYAALWVVDFPLFEYNEDEERWTSMHHPFTSPVMEDLPLLDTEPGKVRSTGFDMVINGWEVGGGSIRIHDLALQKRLFEFLGFTGEDAQEQFGFLLDAMQYGCPPHGGMAFGFDRLCALLGGSSSIRDYMAFPKNNRGRDVMIQAPAPLSAAQLQELSIATVTTQAE